MLVLLFIVVPVPSQVSNQMDGGIIFNSAVVFGGPGFETGCDISYFDGKYVVNGDTFSPYFTLNSSRTNHGPSDFFIASVDVNNPSINWFQILGGNTTDSSYENSIDHQGNIYMVGSTKSLDFITSNALSPFGDMDVYLAKISSGDGQLEWITSIGGNATDSGFGSTIDQEGNIIISGYTSSIDFKTTSGFESPNKLSNAFLAKITPNGELLWSRTFGGDAADKGYMVRTASDNSIFLIGETYSSDLPNAKNVKLGNDTADTFIAKFDALGNNTWSEYLGGSNAESVANIEIDNNDNIYVFGTTSSGDFPSTLLPPKSNDPGDYFLVKLNTNGQIVWSTIYGGTKTEIADSMGLTPDGNLVVGGESDSTDAPMVNPYQSKNAGQRDILLAEFSYEGNLTWSTYFGGDKADTAQSLVIEGNQLVIGGGSRSSNLPGSDNRIQNEDGQVVVTSFNFTQTISSPSHQTKSPSTSFIFITAFLVCLVYIKKSNTSLNKSKS